MESDEDDYMSDKLLEISKENDVRPGLLFNSREKRSHEAYKKQQELKAKKPKNYQEQEKETREKALSTAISSDNKGFQLLQKMGFQPGASLGKSQQGLKEPINIVVKQTNSGVGREQHVKEVMQKKQVIKNTTLEKQQKTYIHSKFQKTILQLLKNDFIKAQRVCEELDFRNKISKPHEDYFWTKETVAQLKKKENDEKTEESEDDSSSSSDDNSTDITEENLFQIIDYLRGKYLYCIYCAFTATDEEDLQTNCPGPYRLDHDDDN